MSAHPREELPGLVLGELTPDAAAELYGHLDDCGRCQRDLDEVRRASDALKAAAAVPEGERLVLEPPSPAPPPRSRRARLRTAAIVAVLVVLVSGIAGIASLRSGRQQAGIEAGPATALAPVGGGDSDASGQAKVTGDERRKVVTLETMLLAAPGEGRYYQAWLAMDGQAPSLALGVLSTDNQGLWSVPASVTERYRGQRIEVWLEPDDGNPAANGRAVLRGPFRP